MQNNKSKQSEKARIGAIGENLAIFELMLHGWDAFNLNSTLKNYKDIDLVCIRKPEDSYKPWKPQVSLIQVKTCRKTNIPIGFTLEDCLNKEILEQNVIGPYVFIYINKLEDYNTYRYFILSRKQFIELAYQTNEYYVKRYHRNIEVNTKSPAGINVRWLEGQSENETKKHGQFINPLHGVSCENRWENIWED